MSAGQQCVYRWGGQEMCCMDLINSESHREIQYPDFTFEATVVGICWHTHAWLSVVTSWCNKAAQENNTTRESENKAADIKTQHWSQKFPPVSLNSRGVRKKGREWGEPELNFTLVVKQQPSWDDVFFCLQQQNAPNWNVTGRSGCSYGDASVHLLMCTSIRSVGGRCVCVYGSS